MRAFPTQTPCIWRVGSPSFFASTIPIASAVIPRFSAFSLIFLTSEAGHARTYGTHIFHEDIASSSDMPVNR